MKNFTLVVFTLITFFSTGKLAAAEFCDDNYHINQTFNNNANWDMCWTHDSNEGIRLHHIFYTPVSGERRMVLSEASIAQIHVPYDDNGARYHDVSDFGLGSDNLLTVDAAECASGLLGRIGNRAVICQRIKRADVAWRNGIDTATQYYLSVLSTSRVGEYLYTAEWKFYSDGRIEPTLLATGALQRYAGLNQEVHGWLMPQNQLADRRVGLSHMHNFFWRLDFDLDNTPNNDRVEEINFTVAQGRRSKSITTFANEAARSVDPQRMRSWLISDTSKNNAKGHAIAYEIRLPESGQREIGPNFEPFTRNDFYVTRVKSCERVASHNRRVHACSTDNLSEFVNGESLAGQDVVSWVGLSFYHMPRAEDAPYMDAHISKFEITPRDWHAVNPLRETTATESSRLVANDDYVNVVPGGSVTINPLSNDTGNGIRIDFIENPANGTASVVGNQIEYQPNEGFNGTDVFWYNIVDNAQRQQSARIHVTVANDARGNGSVSSGGGLLSIGQLLMLFALVAALKCLRRQRFSA